MRMIPLAHVPRLVARNIHHFRSGEQSNVGVVVSFVISSTKVVVNNESLITDDVDVNVVRTKAVVALIKEKAAVVFVREKAAVVFVSEKAVVVFVKEKGTIVFVKERGAVVFVREKAAEVSPAISVTFVSSIGAMRYKSNASN